VPAALAFLRRIAVLVRLGAPPTLVARVIRWTVRFFAREFAFQYIAILAVLIVLGVVFGLADEPVGLAFLVVLGLLMLIEIRFAWLAIKTTRAIEAELREEIPGDPPESRFPKSHLWFPLLMLWSRSVKVERGVVFHSEEKRRVRLDIYRPSAGIPDDERRPALIQVHGGGWILGSRAEQGIPLLNHMAANGWIGFNVDYWLSPRATLPEHVIDVKRAIAWVREHADELGVDPKRIAITGGSAGGHLAALAALTAEDRSLQPGFEDADTSVMAAVPFYGIYDFQALDVYAYLRDWLFEKVVLKATIEDAPELYRDVSPTHRVNGDAPPFLIFHGDQDSLVPVEDARAFTKKLEAVSQRPVLYVEMPGAEHAFDIFPSLRTARVVEGIERFLREEAAA
jgi:acetyl esterase/lipase